MTVVSRMWLLSVRARAPRCLQQSHQPAASAQMTCSSAPQVRTLAICSTAGTGVLRNPLRDFDVGLGRPYPKQRHPPSFSRIRRSPANPVQRIFVGCSAGLEFDVAGGRKRRYGKTWTGPDRSCGCFRPPVPRAATRPTLQGNAAGKRPSK